jgi:hypothetical protein
MPTQRTTVYGHEELRRLLHPQSVAVIGASARAGSFGERVLLNQQNFAGRTYPVNARYEKIGEVTCYPSVGALPEVPDCAVITADLCRRSHRCGGRSDRSRFPRHCPTAAFVSGRQSRYDISRDRIERF